MQKTCTKHRTIMPVADDGVMRRTGDRRPRGETCDRDAWWQICEVVAQ